MSVRLLLTDDDAAFESTAALCIAQRIGIALAARGCATVVLAGGATPEPVYRALADLPDALDWNSVELYFGDERCVPPDHPDSNYRMVQEALVARLRGPEPAVFRIRGEEPDPARAAEAYEALLPAAADLVLLGMGADGHTASLFPGSEAFERPGRRVLAVRGPKPPTQRITITPSVIEQAREVLVLVRGAAKAQRVAEALEGPLRVRELPIQLARNGTWILDRPAAANLARSVQ